MGSSGVTPLQSYLTSLRSFSRNVRLYLIVTGLLGFASTGGIYGVLFGLYLLRMGFGPEFVGLVAGISSLASAIFCLPASAAGQRWGHRRALIVGIALMLVGCVLLPLAEWIPAAGQRTWIIAIYLFRGLGLSLYMVSLSPAFAAASTPVERPHVFAVRVAMMPLAGFGGSLVGGLLPGVFARILDVSPDIAAPYRMSLWVAALLTLPTLPVLLATQKTDDKMDDPMPAGRNGSKPPPIGVSAPIGIILLLSLVGFLRIAGEGATGSFFTLYLDTDLVLPTPEIGALIGIARLLAIPTAMLAPLAMARWGIERTVAIGAVGVALGLILLGLIPHWAAAGIGLMVMTALAAIARSAFIVYSLETVSARWRVTMSAATTMAAHLSRMMTSFGGGLAVPHIGYRGLFLAGAALTAAGALLFWIRFCPPLRRGHDPSLT